MTNDLLLSILKLSKRTKSKKGGTDHRKVIFRFPYNQMIIIENRE